MAETPKQAYARAWAASKAYNTKLDTTPSKTYSQLVGTKGIQTAKVSGGSTASATHAPTYALPSGYSSGGGIPEMVSSISVTQPVNTLTKETRVYVTKDTGVKSYSSYEMYPSKDVRIMDVSKGFLGKANELSRAQDYQQGVENSREMLYRQSKNQRAGALISGVTGMPEYIQNAPAPLSDWVSGRTALTMGGFKSSLGTEIKARMHTGVVENYLTKTYNEHLPQVDTWMQPAYTLGYKTISAPFKNPLGYSEAIALGAIMPGASRGAQTGLTYFLGSKAGSFALKDLMGTAGGWYAGSVAAKTIMSSNPVGTFGDILGGEIIPFSIGYGIGGNILGKTVPKEIIRVEPKIKYAPYKPIAYEEPKFIQDTFSSYGNREKIEYAPYEKVSYAPKITGEIFTPGFRPVVSSWPHFASDYEAGQYYGFKTNINTGMIETSEWAKFEKPLNAFNIGTKEWTAPQRLSSDYIIKLNLNQFGRFELPETYYNVDTGWATELTKPAEQFRGLIGKYHPTTEITGNIDLGMDKPVKMFSKNSAITSKEFMQEWGNVRQTLENQDYLVNLGRSGNTEEMYNAFYKRPFETSSPNYNLNVEYFNAESNYMRYPTRPTPPINDLGNFNIGLKATQTQFNIGVTQVGWAKGMLQNIGVLNVFKTSSVQKIGLQSDLGLNNRQKQISYTGTMFSLKSIQDVGLKSKSITSQVQVIMPDVILKPVVKTTHHGTTGRIKAPEIIPIVPIPINPFTPGKTPIDIIPKPIKTVTPGLPKWFNFEGGRMYKKKGSKGMFGLSFGYAPSVEAGVFNIKGMMPSRASYTSGLTLRPIVKL